MKKEKDPQRPKAISFGFVAAALTLTSGLSLAAYAMTPTQAFTDSELCVTATRVDDPKIFKMQCQTEPTPTPNPTTTSTPSSSATATPMPTSTPTPIVLPTGIANGEAFSNPVVAVSDMRKLVPLDDGGMIVVKTDGIYITEKMRVEQRKLIGIDAKLSKPLGVEASADGQTIAVYTDQYVQVSWDGGATWLAPQVQRYYSIEYRIGAVSVAESGSSLIAVTNRPTTPDDSGQSMSLTKQTGTWKLGDIYYGYKPSIAKDGLKAAQPNFSQELIRSISVSGLSSTSTGFTLSAYNFKAFAASGDLKTQLATMDSYDSIVNKTAEEKKMALRVSRDSGKTWKYLLTGNFSNLQVSSDAQTMIAVDDYSKLRLSKDSGVTWNIVDPIGNGALVNAAELSPDGKSMLIIAKDGKIYQASVAQVAAP